MINEQKFQNFRNRINIPFLHLGNMNLSNRQAGTRMITITGTIVDDDQFLWWG